MNHQGKVSVGHFKCGGSADNSSSRRMLRHNVVRIIAPRLSNCPVCETWRPQRDTELPSRHVHIQKAGTKSKFRSYRAIVQAITRRLPTASVRVQPLVSSCAVIMWIKRHRVPQITSVSSSNSGSIIIIICPLHIRSNNGRHTNWTHSHPTL